MHGQAVPHRHRVRALCGRSDRLLATAGRPDSCQGRTRHHRHAAGRGLSYASCDCRSFSVDRAEATQYAGDVGFLPTGPGPDSKEFSMRTSLSSASTEAHLSRRTFLAATTAAVTLGGASRSVPVARALGAEPRPEWRNKH